MTVIVYSPTLKEMYVDSKHTWADGASQSVTKIGFDEAESGKIIYAVAGYTMADAFLPSVFALVREKKSGVVPVDLPDDYCGAEALVVFDGRCFVVDFQKKGLVVSEVKNEMVSLGSGGSWFRAYFSEESVTYTAFGKVCMYNGTCGFPFEIVDVVSGKITLVSKNEWIETTSKSST